MLVSDEHLIVAVADGVSESPHSQVAAETAARSACKLVADRVGRKGPVDWVNLSRRVSMRIVEEAEYRQLASPESPKQSIEDRLRATRAVMATTLIVAVMERMPTRRGCRCEVAVVAGDSEAFRLRAGAFEIAVGGKDNTDMVTSSDVRPLPGPVEPVRGELFLQPGDSFFVGTDGIGDMLGDGMGEAGRELAGRWAAPPTIDRYFCDVNSYRRTFDDDRTAVGVWLRPDLILPPIPGESPLTEVPGDQIEVAEVSMGAEGGVAHSGAPGASHSRDASALQVRQVVPPPDAGTRTPVRAEGEPFSEGSAKTLALTDAGINYFAVIPTPDIHSGTQPSLSDSEGGFQPPFN